MRAILILANILFVLHAFADVDNILKNNDFTERTEDGKIASWLLSGDAEANDGTLTLPLCNKRKDSETHTASAVQNISEINPGQFFFSAYYRGEINNLYVVVRSLDAQGKRQEPLAKWLNKKDFIQAADQAEWHKFFYPITMPDDAVRASIHIEPWGQQGKKFELKQVKFYESDD
jgi:hypothetical protein